MSASPVSPIPITKNELRLLRMRAQGLRPPLTPGSLIEAVRAVVGVNAQLPSAMTLSLRARVQRITNDEIEHERVEKRSVVRTWCMRGTMHLLAAADLDWLLSSVTPAELRLGWRWLEKRGGLEPQRASQVLEDASQILKVEGPLRRSELMEALAATHGSEVKSAAAGVVHLNGMLGRVCFGPNHGAAPTYVHLETWLGREFKVSPNPDYARVARRYLKGYGPAAPPDLTAWWGMGSGQAKAAWSELKDELAELDVEGEPAWMLASELPALDDIHPADRSICLLPAFDTYLLGYKKRDFAVPPEFQPRVFHSGEIAPTILVDGCAAGTWRYASRGKRMLITATPFTSFTPEIRDGIAAEAEDIGRFYGLSIDLKWEGHS